ncbi:Uncharacterised protein [Bordetella pertussis]|nr:Uncharacterised protein [Bordetella pertussis]
MLAPASATGSPDRRGGSTSRVSAYDMRRLVAVGTLTLSSSASVCTQYMPG